MKLILFSLLLVFVLSEVESFTPENAQKFLQGETERIILITKVGEQSDNAKAVINELDNENLGISITISDTDDQQGLADRLAEYLGVSIDSAPHLFFYDTNNNKFLLNGEYKLESIKTFINDVRDGRIKQHIKSQPIPNYSQNDVYQVVVGDNWIQEVVQSNKQSFVYIYAPWCRHCQDFAPIFEKLAKQFTNNQNIKFVKIDGTANDLLQFPTLQGFPTIAYFTHGSQQPFIMYEGDRSQESIVEFIQTSTKYDWVDLVEVQVEVQEQEIQTQL